MRSTGRRTIDLGTFEIPSGRIIATDPCYEDAGSDPGIPAKKGVWVARVLKAQMGDWGDRCCVLWAHHEDHPVEPFTPGWQDSGGTGVDSGQAGFFDRSHFNDAAVVTEPPENPLTGTNLWYDLCCDRTLKAPGAGIIPFGCVSSSGLGDGGYPVLGVFEGKEATALGLDFQLLGPGFTPALEGAGAELYRRMRAGDLDGAREVLAREPGVLDDPFFAAHALHNGMDDMLLAMLESPGGQRIEVDVYHVVQEENVELLLRLRPHLRGIPKAYLVLGALRFVSSVEVALELSEALVAAGMDANPLPEGGYMDPAAFQLVPFLREGYEKLLEFWIGQGLDLQVQNTGGERLLDLDYMPGSVRQVLEAALAKT